MISTDKTPIKISAEETKMRTVMGSPIKTTPMALPKTPDRERKIATRVAVVYF